jgi:methylmalonyl-CoA/ethylmalonyl-CoA epimerase
MDYREKAKLNQNKSMRIKHMAFAVKSVDISLKNFQSLLSVSNKTEKVIWEKAETKVAIFYINDIEFQLCESLEKNGRFTKWIEKYGEGLHHICYEVDDIDKVLDHAKLNNAKLRICEACNVYGSHPHPEGFVAFLDDESAGTEIEFMQVYNEEELKKYKVTGI